MPTIPSLLLMEHLPLLLRLVAASIIKKQHQVLLNENAFLRAENRYLWQSMPARRLTFTVAWKRRFAEVGSALGWKRLGDVLQVASVRTVQGWHRLLRQGKLSTPTRKTGRPRTDAKIEKLIVRMATENPSWGYLRIVGELRKSGIRVGRTTIAEILKRHGIEPLDPQRRTRESIWRQFITEHKHEIAATDFFTVDVWSWLGWGIGKQTIYVLFAIHLATRRVEILGATDHPNEAFMRQIGRNATMEGTGWLKKIGARYLIYDRDTKFCKSFQGVLERANIKAICLPPSSPNLNAFAERWVRTVTSECLRRVICLGLGGLVRVLREFLDHYHEHRPHQSLGNRPLGEHIPIQKLDATVKARDFKVRTTCGGIIKQYYRDAA
jgi:putative transposase